MTQNLSQTYKPTLMEKLLGRNYKWWFILRYKFFQRTTHQIDTSLFALGQILVLFGTVLTWFLASGGVFDSEFQSRLTYFVTGTFFINLINTWPSFYGYYIKTGKHTQDLLYPCSALGLLWAKWTGIALYQNFVVLIIIAVLSPIWINFVNIPFNLFNISLALA